MDKLGLDKVNLVGHSFGGGYASNFAIAYPKNKYIGITGTGICF